MAAIIWAEHYLSFEERLAAGLEEPLTSKDLDLRGSRAHALIIWGLWGGQGEKHELRWKDTGRISWAMATHPKGDPQRRVVAVTEQVPGLPNGEGIALRLTHRGLRLHVLDPVSCLKAKSDVLRREMAGNLADERNDARHLMLLLAVVPRYLDDLGARSSSLLDAKQERSRSEAATLEAGRPLEDYRRGLRTKRRAQES